ncbi:hypothetical protein [Paenibacillus sanfengchensis]|uniref:hypothetical protein n=1 Tax=Paenibacillus sanfengchensis TaxID=3119819 RepID=UPI002FE04428
MPYQNYQLEVGGKVLEGGIWLSPESDLPILRFERNAELVIIPTTPIALIGKYKVYRHEGNKTPFLLSNVSTKHQNLTTQIGGYPVKWTVYLFYYTTEDPEKETRVELQP